MKHMYESLESIIGLAAFIILTIVSKKAIEEMLDMTGMSSWILGGCIAALAILGMSQPGNGESGKYENMPYILILYGAFGLSCLLAMLLGLLFRNPKRRERFLRWFNRHNPENNNRMRK
jgi:hypothetical protein